MIRICISLLVVFIFCECSQNIKYYHGYVYETKNKPASGLIIKSLKQPSDVSIVTDSKGYFKIDNPEWVNNYIYIYRNKTLLDSIQTRRIRGGEQIVHYFVNGRNDTIFLDTKYQ